jgi:hypothetical protein
MAAYNPLQSLINPLDPSSAANAYQIQRQQALAQALQQQAFQPLTADLPQNMPIQPKLGIGHGLTKVAQALMAGMMARNADESAGNMAKTNMEALSRALDPTQGAQPVDPSIAAPAALQMGAGTGSVGPTAANGERMDAMTTPAPGATGSPLNPVGMNAKLAAYMLQTSPEKFFELQGKFYEPTTMQKDNRYLGINTGQARGLEIGKRTKEATMELQPGTTAINFATGAERFQPKVGEGQILTNGTGGPEIGNAPGYVSAVGEVERAKEGAKAGLDMVTVNTPNGPVMMTREQAVKMSGGGNSPTSLNYKAPNGGGLDFEGQSPQQIFDTLNRIKDPAMRQEAVGFYNDWAKGNGKPGIALQDEGSSEANKTAGRQGIDTIFTQYGALRSAPEMITSLEQAKALAPKSYAGSQGETKLAIAKFFNNNMGTTIAADKVANTEELRSTLFRQVMDNLKKMDSAPSEGQQKILQQAMGTIGTDPAAIPRVIQITQDILSQRVNQHNDTVKQAMKRGAKFPFEPVISLPSYKGAAKPDNATSPMDVRKAADAILGIS